MERFFVAMSQAWEEFEIVEQEFLAAPGTAVLTQVHARARATGRGLDFRPADHPRRRRTLTEVRPFYWDTAAIAAACHP